MAVPPECQFIADEIASLEGKRRALQDDLSGLSGPEKWETLLQIAEINATIKGKRGVLDQCILAHVPGYETEVAVFDLTGDTKTPYTCRLWQLVPPSTQNLRESCAVAAWRIKFVNGASFPGTSIGVSIHDDPSSVFSGALFRSGPLPSLPPGSPTDPTGLIEIGVPAQPPPVTSAAITAGLPALPMTVAVNGPLGITALTIGTLTVSLGAGTVDLTIGATTTVPLGIFGTITLPFFYTLTVAIVPSLNVNDVTEVCVVTPTGPGVLATPLGGLAAGLLGIAAPAIEPALRAAVVARVQTALNAVILATAASTAGLTSLPPGVVVSMRRVIVALGGIFFWPALGAYGGLLSKLPPP